MREPAKPDHENQEPEPPAAAPADGGRPGPSRALVEFHVKLLAATPRTYFTYLLLAGNVAAFAVMAVCGVSVLNPSPDALIVWGANYGPRTLSGEWWRLLTAMFIHIGIIHLLCNMWGLYVLGRFVERLLGNAAFIILYLLAGLAGSLASLAWNPTLVAAGASGAILGIFGALLACLIRLRREIPAESLGRLWKSVIFCVGINVVLGLSNPHIDNSAHLGGLLGGFLAALALVRPLDRIALPGGWKRGALVGLASAVVLAGAAALLPRDVADFETAIEESARHESRAVEVYNDGLSRVKAGSMTNEQWAESIEKEALPSWKAMAASTRGLKGLPGSLRERADKLAAYAEASEEWMGLRAQALRTNDPELAAKAMAKKVLASRILKDDP